MMTRNEFLRAIVKGAGGAAAVALVVGCSSNNTAAAPDAAAVASCTTNGTVDTIAANHGHVLTVSKEDVVAGVDKTYDIQGTATHTHSVTVTAATFATLQANMAASLTSTTNAMHSHGITIVCA
jgi:basic membrane lipoprotein Med (substrate-binding protein (PBP1-ABC) superfamily)